MVKISFHLLACMLSSKKLAIILTFVPVYVMCVFSFGCLQDLSLSSVFSILNMICVGVGVVLFCFVFVLLGIL